MESQTEMWRTLRQIIMVISIIGGTYFLILRPTERMLSGTKLGLQQGLEKVLGTITKTDTRIVEGRVEIVQTSEVAELSLLEMRMSATRTIEKSEEFSGIIPLGTKRLIVRGDYRVKCGYSLKKGVSLRMEKGKPVARFPKPEILSVELIDHHVLSEDDGWLNRVQPADRAQILRELREQMHEEARKSGMLETVESSLRTRLRDLLDTDSVTVERDDDRASLK